MRLIDEDIVLQVIKSYQDFPYGTLCLSDQINKIPTAYDIDKVIEQLNMDKQQLLDKRNDCITLSDREVNDAQSYVYDRVIEIVERGGMKC